METAHLDISSIRQDFPVLDQEVHGKKLVYLDSAATCQTPRAVTDALAAFYDQDCANIHRGVYQLSQRATDLYEAARGKVQAFMNAAEASEIIFTRGTTEAINLVASSLREQLLGSGDDEKVSEKLGEVAAAFRGSKDRPRFHALCAASRGVRGGGAARGRRGEGSRRRGACLRGRCHPGAHSGEWGGTGTTTQRTEHHADHSQPAGARRGMHRKRAR